MAGYDDEAREIFDGLCRFRLAHPSEIDPRLMDWHVPNNDGNDSAFDGDADIAYGLLLAEAQWGNDGPIDYGAAFAETVAGILESTIGPQSRLPMLGDWTDPNGSPYNQDTPRTSDFMIGHFRAFRRATGDGVWDNVISACQDVIADLQANFSPDTGLLPEFAVEGPEPAPPGFLGSAHADDYDYNAGRVPWRLGTDALLNGDATSTAQAAAITKWATEKTSGNPAALDSGYTLAGVSYADYFSTFFAAPMGVAAMTDPDLQDWLNALYGAVYNVSENYYEDTVTLLCLLVMTGNFWDPTLA
jgi:endo-1,4-beta-D-glucanase Y